MKHVSSVELQFRGENLSALAKRQEGLRLSPMLGRESRQLLFEGVHAPTKLTLRRYCSAPSKAAACTLPLVSTPAFTDNVPRPSMPAGMVMVNVPRFAVVQAQMAEVAPLGSVT